MLFATLAAIALAEAQRTGQLHTAPVTGTSSAKPRAS
jgi:hypothetical protein